MKVLLCNTFKNLLVLLIEKYCKYVALCDTHLESNRGNVAATPIAYIVFVL
ncbi:hypothetical protein APA_4953 [Pseudanabaena sp. lw0831]|nr:hypothetical protein APA_4953 [Pseudanabaena sp. lw0831]